MYSADLLIKLDLSFRSCLELGDPRCMWNSKPLDSSSSNACIYSTKYLTKDYWSTSKGNTVDSCPEEKVIALPVFIPPANTQTLKGENEHWFFFIFKVLLIKWFKFQRFQYISPHRNLTRKHFTPGSLTPKTFQPGQVSPTDVRSYF